MNLNKVPLIGNGQNLYCRFFFFDLHYMHVDLIWTCNGQNYYLQIFI
jgi:hypothetical protein